VSMTKPVARNGYGNPFFHLLPYIEQGNLYQSSLFASTYQSSSILKRPIKTYICPADPGTTGMGLVAQPPSTQLTLAAGCYGANVQVFGVVSNPATGVVSGYVGSARIPASFADGTSQTILFAEKYASCGKGGSGWGEHLTSGTASPWQPLLADSTRGSEAVGAGSKFQLMPTPYTSASVCDAALAQTAHSGGILVCLGDGSVRIVSPAVSGTTWWAAFTPSAGDLLDADWN
jgi:hypothetical protein